MLESHLLVPLVVLLVLFLPAFLPSLEVIGHGPRGLRHPGLDWGWRAYFNQPLACSRPRTRSAISARISRTRSTGLPLGSSSGQSSRSWPGTTGHASPQPMVTSNDAVEASSRVSFCGATADRSTPSSSMACTTSACTWLPGSVPAEMARAFAGSASWLNKAAAICDRPALCTQANRTVFMIFPQVLPPVQPAWRTNVRATTTPREPVRLKPAPRPAAR